MGFVIFLKIMKSLFTQKNINTNVSESDNSSAIDIWKLDETLIESKENGEDIRENNKGFVIRPEDFGPLKDLVMDDFITDIDFNGKDLWTIDQNNKKVKHDEINVSTAFIRRLAQNIANAEATEFNQQNPSVEAETEDLRISIIHNSIAQTGTTVCIRKTPIVQRILEKNSIESGYCSREILALLANCVKAHMNIIICGEPRAGKTECAKFISGYILPSERVITIEDVQEWHYKTLHPDSDCIEMKVNKVFDYSQGIIASLKQNPNWLMIAETRGKEVKNLLQGFTTGVKGITTLHTDDVRKIPKRIVNMVDDSVTERRTEDDVYDFVDVGVYISMHSDGNGGQVRMIDQVGFFSNDEPGHVCRLAVERGNLFRASLPKKIRNKFLAAGIDNPLQNDEVDRRLAEQGYDFKDRPTISISLFEEEKNRVDKLNMSAYKDKTENSNNNLKTDAELEMDNELSKFDDTENKGPKNLFNF